MGPPWVIDADGVPTLTVGAVLSTMKVVLAGTRARLRRVGGVPEAIENAQVPSPVMLLTVIVRVLPVPVTPMVPVAVPVEFSVTLAGARLTVPRLASA